MDGWRVEDGNCIYETTKCLRWAGMSGCRCLSMRRQSLALHETSHMALHTMDCGANKFAQKLYGFYKSLSVAKTVFHLT